MLWVNDRRVVESLTIKMSIFLGKLVAKSIVKQIRTVYMCTVLFTHKRELYFHTYPMEEEGVKSRTHIDSGYKIIFKNLCPYFVVWFFCKAWYTLSVTWVNKTVNYFVLCLRFWNFWSSMKMYQNASMDDPERDQNCI